MRISLPTSGKRFVLACMFGCFVLGYLGAYAMTPFDIWPLMFLALGGLYYFTARAQRPPHAFFIGYAFGIGYFVSGLAWIGNAFEVEGNPFSWVMPIAVIGLPMVLSFFPALTAYAARRWLNLEQIGGFLGFTAMLAFSEWTRGHIFSGFPWNLYGHTWSSLLPALQIISVTNVYFLTLLTVFWMALPGFLWLKPHFGTHKQLLVVAALSTFIASFVFGLCRLHEYPTQFRDDVYVNVVQPNIPQSEKWQADKMVDAFYKHVELSYAKLPEKATTFVIWPETALTPWFANDRSSMQAIKDSLQSYAGKAYLLTGLLRHDETDDTAHNSLVLINDKGQTLESYDKSHLVPFGEYVPFQKFIPIKPVANFRGFVHGKGAQTFTTPEGLHYSPMVCYEIIFSGAVVDEKGPRPDFLVNITNDAWYGDSPGPYQHFEQARFRAIEEGIPVIRSANTGVSGVIDPVGRILSRSYLFEEASLLEPLPKTIGATNKNPYLKEAIFFAFTLALGLAGFTLKL